MRCEKCGGRLEYRIKGSTQGLFCEKCGWNVVTTYISPIKRDHTIYKVFILKNCHPFINQIKTVSKICNRNYLEVRRLFMEEQTLIYEGYAETVLAVIENLENECLLYKISPPFPYRLDQHDV